MDMSKEYIKMCEWAVEIQKVAPREEDDGGYGSFFWNIENKKIMLHHFDNDEGHNMIGDYGDGIYKKTWLPRQDQLQEMVEIRDGSISPLHSLFIAFVMAFRDFFHNDRDCEDEYKSFEQLWLAFVMHEKYGKIWNDKTWEKATEYKQSEVR